MTQNNRSTQAAMDARMEGVAAAFVEARLEPRPLESYPGPMPSDLPEAYRCQQRAVELWPDAVAGWKVGSIRADIAAQVGQNRLIGPIFKRAVRRAVPGEALEFRTFPGGFAAAEPEYVLRLGEDAPAGRTGWTVDEARALVDRVYRGVEIAGSPFPEINDHGPAVVVSDFGNNDGLILGDALEGWQDLPLDAWSSRLYIDDVLTGEGSVADLVGGPFESLRFALVQVSRMGGRLRAGDVVSTGAITGVHRVFAGQGVRATYGPGGEMELVAI